MNCVMYELAALVKKPAFGVQDAVLQGDYGDTRYYLTPTYPVPLLIPVSLVPKIGPIVADMLDPALRVLVEAGYDRTISPGQPTPADFRYFPKPIALSRNLLLAMRTGIDNGLQDIIEIRPLETTRPDVTGQGAYGINGPPVTMQNATAPTVAAGTATATPTLTGTRTVKVSAQQARPKSATVTRSITLAHSRSAPVRGPVRRAGR